jgi:hypothetical protein
MVSTGNKLTAATGSVFLILELAETMEQRKCAFVSAVHGLKWFLLTARIAAW